MNRGQIEAKLISEGLRVRRSRDTYAIRERRRGWLTLLKITMTAIRGAVGGGFLLWQRTRASKLPIKIGSKRTSHAQHKASVNS